MDILHSEMCSYSEPHADKRCASIVSFWVPSWPVLDHGFMHVHSAWKMLLNNILFGLFFNPEKQQVFPSEGGCAVVQAVSRQLPTIAAWIPAKVMSCGICGGQSGSEASFSPSLWFPLPSFPLTAPHSLLSIIIWGWYSRLVVTSVPLHPGGGGLQMDFYHTKGGVMQCCVVWQSSPLFQRNMLPSTSGYLNCMLSKEATSQRWRQFIPLKCW
jgi:hypothetical protein